VTSSPSVGLVLIHGGEHSAWCWDRVVPLLNYPAVAVALPGREPAVDRPDQLGLRDFVDHTATVAASTGWDEIVVVAHSMGGMTACGLVATMPDPMRHLVLISCLIPREGERAIDYAPRGVRHFLEWGFRRGLARDGTYQLPGPLARRLFCSDLDAADTNEVLRRRCREPAALVLEPFEGRQPSADLPKTWVRLLRDKAVRPRIQDRVIEQLGGARVVEIDAGHDVMIGHPAELANVINTVAASSFRAAQDDTVGQ
jgi:pimeloyl-ACP methyl ester carboxylesterase